MHHVQKLLLFLLLFPIYATSQNISLQKLIGKTFISTSLDYLEFINDSVLYSSINSYNDTAHYTLTNNILQIEQHYLYTDKTRDGSATEYYDYKVECSADTLFIVGLSVSGTRKITNKKGRFFLNLDNIKETVSEFKYITVNCSSPWVGEKIISIDGLGTVDCRYKGFGDKSWKVLRGKLINNEFVRFLNLLSRSLPSRLPAKRGCPIDGGHSDFRIAIGDKVYESIGCNLSWSHETLFSFLYTVDKNKNLRRLN
jgi:hypothetical protein